MECEIVQGDIAHEHADALVNAAGTSLRMGSEVAGALRRGANGPINEEAMEKGPIELGEVAVTDAYDLDADHVIHTAAMPHYGDGQATEDSIREATRNSLERAEELNCTSVVVPGLGTGAAGFDFERGARIVWETIDQYEAEVLEDVGVIAYSDEEFESLQSVAREMT